MTLHYETSGEGKPVVLLHGMAGSSRYWRPLEDLKPEGYRFIAIDLFGFGMSPKPHGITYNYQAHISAILETLRKAGVDGSFSLVGHSMGSLIALRLAAEHPSLINGLVLCSLPYYPNVTVARADITKSRKILQLTYYGPTSQAICTVWCKWLYPISKHLAPLYLRHMPPAVAADSLLHSWQSYSESLENVIERQDIAQDIRRLSVPVSLLYGAGEKCSRYLLDSSLLKDASNIQMKIHPGSTHHLPVENPQLVLDALDRFNSDPL